MHRTRIPRSTVTVLVSLSFLVSDLIMASTNDEQIPLTRESYAFVVDAMPLNEFITTAFSDIDLTISPSLANISVSGVFEGNANDILDALSEQYAFALEKQDSSIVISDVVSISNVVPDPLAPIDFEAHQMPIAKFLGELAQVSNHNLNIDYALSGEITGRFTGSLNSILDTLSLGYSLVFDISDSTLSVVDESQRIDKEMQIPDAIRNIDAFNELITKIAPAGNYIDLNDQTISIGGHPSYVIRIENLFYSILTEHLASALDNTNALIEPVAAVNQPKSKKIDSIISVPEIPIATPVEIEVVVANTVKIEKSKSDSELISDQNQNPQPIKKPTDYFAPLEQVPGFY